MFSKDQARILFLATQGETFSLDEPVSEWEEQGSFLREGGLEKGRCHQPGSSVLIRNDAACLDRAGRQKWECMGVFG